MTSRSHYEKLEILPVGKTVVFYSPIEGEDDLVRTGVLSEGSSLFHAMLHAYSRDYVSMDSKGRIKFADKLQQGLIKDIDWKKESVKEIEETVGVLMNEFYDFIVNDKEEIPDSIKKIVKNVIKSEEDIQIFTLITELLPSPEITEEKLALVLDDFGDSLSSDRRKVITLYFKKLLEDVTHRSEKSVYKTYKPSDSRMISLLSKKFKRDVYILDGKGRMPIPSQDSTGVVSNILLHIDDHYEIVGRLLSNQRIQRDFEADDTLIERIKTYLFEPEKISTFYPKLNKYLPKKSPEYSDSD